MASGKELKALVSISGKVDKSLGSSIQSASKSMQGFGNVAKNISKVAVGAIAALGTGAIAAGKQLVDLGTQFDEAYDTIRIGTGATGKDLEGLEDTMKDVYSAVPTNLEDAGSAIADLNTRLGLTGDNLETVSEQAIQVSSMLGEDLSSTIEESSQAFQQWGISADDMSGKMDYIFKVSQSTGMGFNDLMSNMQSYGAQLQNMGFDFDTAAALMGQLDKAGVNTNEVLGAMKKSVTTMAKNGKSATDGLKEYYNAIKNAKTETEATSKASEVFGARAASTMAAAIRNGTLDVNDLTKSLQNSQESISGAAGDTYDFAEKLQLFKQNIQLAFEPLASTVFDSINDAMPYIQQSLDDLQPKIQDFAKNLGPKISDFVKNTLPQLAETAGKAATDVGELITWVTDNWDTISKVAPVIAGIAVALGPVATGIGKISGFVKGIGGKISSLSGGLSTAGKAAKDAAPAVSSAASSFGTLAGQALLLVAAGAAVFMIAQAMQVLVTAAIQLASAGPAAVGVFVLLAGVAVGVTAAIVAIGSAATISAVGLLALGAAVLMVGSGIAIAAAGAALFCTQLPTIAAYSPMAAAGILALSGAIVGFSASMVAMSASLIAGTATLAAFGLSALTASAGALAFGVSMATAGASSAVLLAALLGIQASVTSINSQASQAASSLTGMANSVNAVQSVLNGLGNLAKSAVSKFLSIFQSAGSQAQADGTILGTSLSQGLQAGLAQANAVFTAGMTAIKVNAAIQLAALKAMFANTKLELNRNIAMPHFSVSNNKSGGGASVPAVNVKWYAQGGFTDGLSIAGENGTEAVISFDPAYRSENLSYWAQAGQMLGVDSGFADILSGQPSRGNTTEINLGGVSFAPNITINGNATKDDVIAAIKEEEPEFFDMLDRYIATRGRDAYGYSF